MDRAAVLYYCRIFRRRGTPAPRAKSIASYDCEHFCFILPTLALSFVKHGRYIQSYLQTFETSEQFSRTQRVDKTRYLVVQHIRGVIGCQKSMSMK